MIKTATLTGALLDYWTARAEGVPAEQLEIRQVQRSEDFHCVLVAQRIEGGTTVVGVVNYSGDTRLWAPLIEKHKIEVLVASPWLAQFAMFAASGTTPQEAICRAVVRAAFGDEVEDVPCR